MLCDKMEISDGVCCCIGILIAYVVIMWGMGMFYYGI